MRLTALAFAVLLAACNSGGENTDETRDAAPETPQDSAPAAPEGETPETPQGDGAGWVYKDNGQGGAALYGEPQTDASFSVRCEAGALVFARAANASPDGAADMMLSTREGETTLEAAATGNELPSWEASLNPADPWTETLMSASQVTVTIDGGDALTAPVSGPVRRVIRTCR